MFSLKILDVCHSTMDDARVAAEQAVSEGFVMQALEQTAARGRFGNAWSAPLGNLYMTIVLRPHTTPDISAQLAFVVALALYDACSLFDQRSIQLKWPNDMMIDGGKAAGILLEQSLDPEGLVDYVLVGIGVNVLAPPEGRMAVKAPSVNALRDALLAALEKRYRSWQVNGFAPLRQDWLLHAYGLNKPMTARMSKHRVTGVFEGLDDTGALQLRTDEGIQLITGADIQFE